MLLPFLSQFFSMMNQLKKNNAFDSNKRTLKKKIEDVDKKIPDDNKFIVSQEFNRLTKIFFHAIIVEPSKNFVTKKQVENTQREK